MVYVAWPAERSEKLIAAERLGLLRWRVGEESGIMITDADFRHSDSTQERAFPARVTVTVADEATFASRDRFEIRTPPLVFSIPAFAPIHWHCEVQQTRAFSEDHDPVEMFSPGILLHTQMNGVVRVGKDVDDTPEDAVGLDGQWTGARRRRNEVFRAFGWVGTNLHAISPDVIPLSPELLCCLCAHRLDNVDVRSGTQLPDVGNGWILPVAAAHLAQSAINLSGGSSTSGSGPDKKQLLRGRILEVLVLRAYWPIRWHGSYRLRLQADQPRCPVRFIFVGMLLSPS